MTYFIIFLFLFTPLLWVYAFINFKKNKQLKWFVLINLILFFTYSYVFFYKNYFGYDEYGLKSIFLFIETFIVHSLVIFTISFLNKKKG